MESLTDASPLDLSASQTTQVRELLSDNLFWFAWFIFGYRDLVPSIHGKIAHLIGLWGTPGYERIMVQIPREFFKTSLCTRANSLWQVCRDPEKPVVIVSEKQDNVAMWVRSIRDLVNSSRLFHVVYKDLCPPGIAFDDPRSTPRWWKWSESELMFPRNEMAQPEASISALGMGAASAGRHWPKMIKDDLISEDAANSPNVMQTAVDWFDKSLYLERPALKGWDLIACTPWSYDDLYAHILRNYNYKLYKRASIENTEGEPDIYGESIFPEKLTTKELLVHYNRDDFGFMSQMQCSPRAGREMSFDKDWDRWGRVDYTDPDRPSFIIANESYDPTILGDLYLEGEVPPQRIPLCTMEKAILFDPAPSEESDIRKDRKARNALIVEGWDPWGRRFILESWAGRLDPYDVIKKIFQLMHRWDTDTLAIEEVTFSKLYRPWIMREAQALKIPIRCKRLKPGKMDKHTRIREKIPPMKQGLYYINEIGCEEWLKEKSEYPYGGTLDCLDAWAYDHHAIMRPESPGEHEQRMIATNPILGRRRGGRYTATGY